ncbi:MAG: DUF3737 family protein [Lachnospiraceae bacterium]|nr:DUF3737 family protein [Lachnospiraceae bacterium]
MEYSEKRFTGERALFAQKVVRLCNCIFADGESPLKHSENVDACRVSFQWKYPLWYSKNIRIDQCAFLEMARAGIWYAEDVELKETIYEAPKGFRRVKRLTLRGVDLPHAQETLWSCDDVKLDGVSAKGDYFMMNCTDVDVQDLRLVGNYCFDGCKNVTVRKSKLLSKDAFWNCENVMIIDSYITGEYLAWNSKNVTLIDCVVESLQGLCYVDNLVMKNCKLINTTYSFEYSKTDAQIDSRIDSVLNPSSGRIEAKEIGDLIIEKEYVDPAATRIVCDAVDKHSDRPDWR